MFTIIIPSYKSQDFIEECLGSIKNQTLFSSIQDYEILLGIDNCHQTLEKVKQIQKNYKNLRVFFFKKNYGPYIIRNTLVSLSSYDNLLFFDSDDIMLPCMVEVINNHIANNKIIQFGYEVYYYGGNIIKYKNNIRYARGVIFYKKDLFDRYGGFQPWRCSADSEFYFRVSRKNHIKKINKSLFKRRVHSDSLTQQNETNEFSKTRMSYKNETLRLYKEGLVKIDRVVGEYLEVVI